MAKTHHVQVGDILCIVLEEGTTSSDFDMSGITQRYPNATEAEVQAAFSALDHEGSTIQNYLNALYIEADGKKILIDAGMGYNPERPQVGKLLASLQAADINPDDIDIVYITHFHGDHYLGLLTDGEATFPNACYVTLDAEWNYWLSDDAKAKMGDRIQGILNIVEPLQDKFSTIASGEEIVAGVSVIAIPGHTMGQSAIHIQSGDDSLLHLVDLLHHTSQFGYPHWHFVYDTDGELAVTSRREQLRGASDNNQLVMFYHLPFPGLGHVEVDGENYKWHPISS